jgi:hypothetical protein
MLQLIFFNLKNIKLAVLKMSLTEAETQKYVINEKEKEFLCFIFNYINTGLLC